MKDFLAGIAILNRNGNAEICAQHDEIHCLANYELPEDDVNQLLTLGWCRDEGDQDDWYYFT